MLHLNINRHIMKKYLLTCVIFCAFNCILNAQTDPKKTEQQPTRKEAPKKAAASDIEFQNQKTDEARQKQEAKRKAMKEKAKIKEQEESRITK